MVSSSLFPLGMEVATYKSPMILWFAGGRQFAEFWCLDRVVSDSQNRLFYAPQNALGSTVGFVVAHVVGSGWRGLFRMVVVVLFLAVSFHCCLLPRPGTDGAGRSKSDRGSG